MRQGLARDIDPARLAKHMSASLALPADLFEGIAKCRALRRGWGGIIRALGLDPDAHRLCIHGAVSIRMFSTLDSEVNMLRTTTALLGGAIGGADQLSAHAHNCLTGDDLMGRRLARMQQHLLIDESGLSRSLDPAGGAGFIGSAVIREAIKQQDTQIINVDMLTYAGNLESLTSISKNDRYNFERADISNPSEMRRILNKYKPDAIMHLAAESHVDRSIDGPGAFMQTNIIGTYTLLEATREYWNNLQEDKKKSFRFHHGDPKNISFFDLKACERRNFDFCITVLKPVFITLLWRKCTL